MSDSALDHLVHLVKGDDPVLRDAAVEKLVAELLGDEDRTLALEDLTVPARARGAAAAAGSAASAPDEGDGGGGDAGESPVFTSVVNALQTPPFMTARRVVVVREVGNLGADQAGVLAGYVTEPSEGTYLVLVGGGGRVPAALDKALKAVKAPTVAPATEKTTDVLALALKEAKLRLDKEASERVAEHLGEDAGRVPEFVGLLRSTFGEGSTLKAADVEPYLGEVGTAAWFDLTNMVDAGDVPGALEVLHRLLHATSAKQPKAAHPLQVMATLVPHFERLLRLDDPSIVTKEQAAEVLGMKSAYAARYRLDAARRLGADGLREAIDLLARADLDLRGRTGAPEETVLEVLVARLAALSARGKRAGTGSRR